MTGETKQTDDSIIELTDVVEDGEDMEDSLFDDILSEEESPDDNVIELAEQAPVFDETSVSDDQIAAALERVIEKKFQEKIEPLLFETMERVILQEIQKIKTTLLKDMDRIGPF